MKILNTILILTAAVIMSSCRGFFIPSEQDVRFEIFCNISPDLGTVGTEFFVKINKVIIERDVVTDFDLYRFRWDYNGDGEFDTDWLEKPTIVYTAAEAGEQQIIIEVETPGSGIYSDSCSFYVPPLIKIFNNTTGHDITSVDFALDGSNRIAYDSPSDNPLDSALCEHVVWTMEYPGGTPKQVSMNCAIFPEWSTGGRYILFRRGNEFWLADLVLEIERPLFTREGVIPFIPSWSHNNINLAYTKLNSIEMYNISTGIFSTISTDITYNLVSWAPDDHSVAGATRSNALSTIDIIDVEEGKKTKSYPLDFRYSGGKLDWSPDKKWLSIGFAKKDNTIYLINLSSGGTKHIKIAGLEGTWYASWAPDSKMLIFIGRTLGENSTIWGVSIPDNF